MPTTYNKVTAGGQTLIDLSQDTVTQASHIMAGYVGHLADGTQVTGTGTGGGGAAITIVDTLDANGGTIRTITAVDISSDTITAAHLESGYTAHDAAGNAVTGSLTPGITPTGTKTIIQNGTGIDVTQYAAVDVAVPATAPNLQAKTNISPTESSQTIEADNGYDGLSSVQINAISSSYVGSGITRRSSTDLSASGATVTVPAGYYASQATKAISNGTAGTPTATKGTVSNHSVSVTPSVTNSAGYISGGTKNGTAVTVTVSELESGNKEITANGTNIDVSGYSTVSVAVPSGSSKNIQYSMGRYEISNTNYTATSHSITVSKAGTYKCYWVMDRNTTSGTTGTRLYNGDTALGSTHTTWTYNGNNRNGMNCEEELTFAANATITVRARSRSTSYICGVSDFIIIEQ